MAQQQPRTHTSAGSLTGGSSLGVTYFPTAALVRRLFPVEGFKESPFNSAGCRTGHVGTGTCSPGVMARELETNEGTLDSWVNEWERSIPEPEEALTRWSVTAAQTA